MATIEARQDGAGKTTYRVKIRLRGYPAVSASFARKTDAKKWAQNTESEIREGKYFSSQESRKHTLGELIDKYMNHRLQLRGDDKETVGPHLLWWKAQLGPYLLKDITPPLLAECRDRLLTEPMLKKNEKKARILSKSTVIRYFASLSVCLSYAVEDLGWLQSNPVRAVKKPKPERGRVRFLSEQERQDLLQACQDVGCPYLYPVVMLALLTGARLGEITGLRWQDIDFKRKRLTFHETKNGDRRSVPISKPAYEILESLNKVRRIDSLYVFARKDGRQPQDIRKKWEQAVAKADLDDFRFHDLRHTAASNLAMSGASLLEIAEILGHKTLAMVKRYSHLTEGHTAEVMERLATSQFNTKDEVENVCSN